MYIITKSNAGQKYVYTGAGFSAMRSHAKKYASAQQARDAAKSMDTVTRVEKVSNAQKI